MAAAMPPTVTNRCFLFLAFSACLVSCQYIVDQSGGFGRTFDGIGGLSGGGATSKLLVNYPEHLRNEILDYLFKPNFAASLHILKVEIGGDSQSTDGTESSHMHESWDENYERGYEWWLMTEAKKRNPKIKLYGLPWAFPGWLGGESHSPYHDPTQLAEYIVKWIRGAQSHYGLTMDYIGIWNERPYNVTYIKTLRSVLDQNQMSSIQIVAPDGGWDISADVLKDAELSKSVQIIGAHYPGTVSTPDAMKTNKTLWASEDYSTFNDNVGGGCWARLLNQNYVNGYMTSTISWNLIGAYYQDLPFGRDGLMTSEEPWSGHYVVESPIWMTAHTTQFTEPGWRYLKHGAGVGKLQKGGSYVTLVSPDDKHFTIVIETMTHNHSVCIRPPLPPYTVEPQMVTFNLKNMGQVTELNAWYSELGFDGKVSTFFEKMSPVKVVNNTFTIHLGLDQLVTLTTVTEGRKGHYPDPPQSADFPLPYRDDFEGYAEYSEAFNFVPQTGVWEVRKNLDGNKVNRQVVLQQPCDWCPASKIPVDIGGNHKWADILVMSDVFIPALNGSSGVFVATRVTGGGCGEGDGVTGVYLVVFTNATYQLRLKRDGSSIHSGSLTEVSRDKWYTLALTTKGQKAYGFWEEKQIFEFDLTGHGAPDNGFAAYGTADWGIVDFDNFAVEEANSQFILF